MKFHLSLLIALLSSPMLASSAEADPWNIHIEMQIVAIPEAQAIPLVSELQDEKRIEGAYAKIQEWLKEGTVKLIGWPLVTTQSRQKAIVEAIDELRYAIEYQPPTASFTPSVETKDPIEVDPEAGLKVDLTLFSAYPFSFETRNTGVTLEVEPVLAEDHKTIALSFIPQHVRLRGYTKTTVESGDTGSKIIVEQPEFETSKVTTSINLRNGQRILAGVFRVTEPANHLEFFILKAEAKAP